MAVISISRQYGAGGRAVGKMVARRLGYRFIDKAILHEVAEEANISQESVESIDRDKGDMIARLVPKLVPHRDFVSYIPGTKIKFNERLFRDFLRTAMVKLSGDGDVVVLGQGGQFILRNRPQTLIVMLYADEKDRIKSLERRYRFDAFKARTVVSSGEENRIKFLQAFNEGDPKDPALYHLLINTSIFSFETATDMICLAAQRINDMA